MKKLLKKYRLARLEEGDIVSCKGKNGVILSVLENPVFPVVSSYKVQFSLSEFDFCKRSELKFEL